MVPALLGLVTGLFRYERQQNGVDEKYSMPGVREYPRGKMKMAVRPE